MVNGLNSSGSRFLAALSRIQSRIEKAERQITSGKRVNTASDDPGTVGLLMQSKAQMEMTTQNLTNLGRVKTEVDTAEGALQDAVSMLEKANKLGTEGATGTETAEQRRVLADQISALMEQMAAAASTTSEGRYVFSGDDYQQRPYTVDLTQTNGVSTYAGGAATRQMTDTSGTRFATGRSADVIFDNSDPGTSVFGALNQLRLALESGPTSTTTAGYSAEYDAQTAAITTAMESVSSAQDYLNGQLSYYGSLQVRINAAVEFGKKLEVRQTSAMSDLEDANVVEAITELTTGLNHQQAALSARARLNNKSLFDYMG